MKTLTDPKSHTTTWYRDAYGRISRKALADGTDAFRYYYDAEGNLTNRWSPGRTGDGVTTYYSYDSVGNLTNIAYPSSSIRYQYDALNQLTNMVDPSGATAFAWTDGGQLASEDGWWTSDKVSYTYAHRLRTAMNLQQPSGGDWVQSYGYDSYGRLDHITSPAGTFQHAAYYGFDLVQQINLPVSGGRMDYRNYDTLGRLTDTTLYSANGSDTQGYTYDLGSQRTQQNLTITDAINSINSNNHFNYAYDNIGQLKTAKGYEPGGTPRLHEQFGTRMMEPGTYNTGRTTPCCKPWP